MRPLIAASAALAVLTVAAASPAATLKADYEFNDSLDSSVGGSQTLLPAGTGMPPLGPYATETVNGQSKRVYVFNGNATGGGQGVKYDASGLASPSIYSTVITARLDTASDLLSKLIDFKNLTSDAGLYNAANTPTFYDAVLPMAPLPTVLTPLTTGTLLVPDNAYSTVALTRNAAGTVAVYVNGQSSFTFADTGGLATISSFLTFFHDDGVTATLTLPAGFSQTESPTGAVDRLQIYDGALTPAEVAALAPEPTSLTALTLGVGAISTRRRRA